MAGPPMSVLGSVLVTWGVLLGVIVLVKISYGAPSASTRRVAKVALAALLCVVAGALIGHGLDSVRGYL